MIAALYVDPRGVYSGLPDVDCWDEDRDARLYAGPWPVVAHPPCGQWGNLRHLVVPGRTRKDDRDCGQRAVEQVRSFGGVLEHPAGSTLWKHCDLPRPGELPDIHGGRTIEVRQVDWGHVARKPTWLYLVRVRYIHSSPPPREPTHWVSGGRNPKNIGLRGIAPPGIKFCSAQQRRRTPIEFARWLVAMAETAVARAVREQMERG